MADESLGGIPKEPSENPHGVITAPVDFSGIAKEGLVSADIVDAPKPQIFRTLTYHDAYMLATLPRGKWSDSAWAYFCGFLGAAPGALHAVHEGYLIEGSKGLSIFQATESAVCLVFATLSIAALLRQRQHKTSLEFLDELVTGKKQEPKPSMATKCWKNMFQREISTP